MTGLKVQKNTKDYLYVGLQLLLFVFYILPVRLYSFEAWSAIKYSILAFGLLGILMILLAILQLNNNLTAYPTPKENSVLIENGLYKYIRHPIYTGILLVFFSWAVYDGSGFKLLISLLLLVLFWFKSGYEEKQLTAKFSGYELYKKRSGRFLPFFSK